MEWWYARSTARKIHPLPYQDAVDPFVFPPTIAGWSKNALEAHLSFFLRLLVGQRMLWKPSHGISWLHVAEALGESNNRIMMISWRMIPCQHIRSFWSAPRVSRLWVARTLCFRRPRKRIPEQTRMTRILCFGSMRSLRNELRARRKRSSTNPRTRRKRRSIERSSNWITPIHKIKIVLSLLLMLLLLLLQSPPSFIIFSSLKTSRHWYSFLLFQWHLLASWTWRWYLRPNV